MKNLKIEVINEIEEAKKVWDKLSPNNVICDDWNYRYCFYKYFNYPLYFYVGLDKEEIIGLFPLQFNKDEKHLEFFGGGFMRDNCVFIKPGYEDCIEQFYNAITLPAELAKIVGEDLFTKSFEIYKYKYVANLSNINDVRDYLAKNFKARSRKKLQKKVEVIEHLDPKIVENNYEDLDLMFELNKKAFGERSSFNKPYRKEAFRDLLKLDFDIHLLTYIINEKKEAVSFSIKYNDVYFYINAGSNKNDMFNLGSYIIYKQIEKAIGIKAKYLDAGMGDLGWKEIWHLEKTPQYMFSK